MKQTKFIFWCGWVSSCGSRRVQRHRKFSKGQPWCSADHTNMKRNSKFSPFPKANPDATMKATNMFRRPQMNSWTNCFAHQHGKREHTDTNIVTPRTIDGFLACPVFHTISDTQLFVSDSSYSAVTNQGANPEGRERPWAPDHQPMSMTLQAAHIIIWESMCLLRTWFETEEDLQMVHANCRPKGPFTQDAEADFHPILHAN